MVEQFGWGRMRRAPPFGVGRFCWRIARRRVSDQVIQVEQYRTSFFQALRDLEAFRTRVESLPRLTIFPNQAPNGQSPLPPLLKLREPSTATSLNQEAKDNVPFRFAVACSGGSDSICATMLMAELCRSDDRLEREIELFAVHVDHQLRPESSFEAEQTQNFLQSQGDSSYSA